MKYLALVVALFCGSLVLFGQNPWDYKGNPRWDRGWNDRPAPGVGACFFKDAGFRGDHFCVSRGDKLSALPGNFGDNISSIQLYGRARVTVFNDRNFSGGHQDFGSNVGDLHSVKFRGGHTWNDRISSIMVR